MKNLKLQFKIKKFIALLIFLLSAISYQQLTISPVLAGVDDPIPPPPPPPDIGNLGPITVLGGFIPNIFAPFESNIGVGGVLEKFFTNTLGFLTLLAGLAFIIYFVLGAFSWLTAAGKPEQLKKAQDQITNALIGLIIIVVAYTVFYVIGKILGLEILSPAKELEKLKP